tara:strand:+ start:13110 stop:13412 length:303 start_codon:yes stop_codon:yes gene_type:complete
MFWIFYYFALFISIYLFLNAVANKFLRYFFTPILIGVFGTFWFIEPGSKEMAPIISILFLETSIVDSNGFERLLRPLIVFTFLLELASLSYYFINKIFLK